MRTRTGFRPTATILAKIIRQLVRIVQTILHTFGHQVCSILSGQPELFHQHFHATNGLASVRVERLRPYFRSFRDRSQVAFTNTTDNRGHVGRDVGHVLQAFTPALPIQFSGNFARVLCGHTAFTQLSVQSALHVNLTNCRVDTGFEYAADCGQCATNTRNLDKLARQTQTQPVGKFANPVERFTERVLNRRRVLATILANVFGSLVCLLCGLFNVISGVLNVLDALLVAASVDNGIETNFTRLRHVTCSVPIASRIALTLCRPFLLVPHPQQHTCH